MKLIFKQRLFSWFDSYDIYDEQGNVVFTVKGELSFGHCLRILDSTGQYVGTVKEKILTFMPKFELYEGEQYRGCIQKEITLFRPRYRIDFNGWDVSGNMMEWDYEIRDQNGFTVAIVSKDVLRFTDTYVLDIGLPEDSLYVVMLVLAIDAEKCSRD